MVTLSNLDIQDEIEKDKKSLPLSLPSNRNISELLFHPANFEKKEIKMMMRTDQDAVKFAESMSKMDTSKINSTDFHNMMFDIQKIYKKINDKLQVYWNNFFSIWIHELKCAIYTHIVDIN